MDAHRPRLLLVDDDIAAIRVMARILADYPEQRFSTSGEAALEQAHAFRPDLILLDADMPGMSGFDLCRALKQDSALADVPVIFATAHPSVAFELSAFDCGAAGFIAKPLQPDRLRARVRAHLPAAYRNPPAASAE